MIRCRELAALLVDYFSRRTSAPSAREHSRHLGWCPNCSSDVEIYQQVLQATRELPDAPVPEPLHNVFFFN